ncbi:MAG: chorismate lyase [Methylococcaceae bacterium]|nr:chorismate lyase [Desulfuromonas sp.]NJD07242.1 chorismate lyase [Methylococcaceae bacterium]
MFRREPAWRPACKLNLPPAAPRAWIDEEHSLTLRLKASCRQGFSLRLLRQAWRRPFRGEAAGLGLVARRRALVREVMLRDGTRPLVLARTVMPPDALRGRHGALAGLGDRPLGEVLFAEPGLRRWHLEICRITPAHWTPAIRTACGIEGEVWGRRSLYGVGQIRLLVAEFFLPAVLVLEAPQEPVFAEPAITAPLLESLGAEA